MFRVLFLILFVMSSFVFAQNQSQKIDEIEIPATSESLDIAFEGLMIKLVNNPTAQGYIITYGTPENIARREFRFKEMIRFRKYDSSKIIFVRGGYRQQTKTEFWIVPAGIEPPKPTPMPFIFDEFGKISQSEWRNRMQILRAKIKEIKDDGSQLVIINYGTEKEIAVADNLINKYLYENCRDCFGYGGYRIVFIAGGFIGKPKRVFWFVPAGAEMPKP
ncbi:MAG TPA: hypothetical protein PKE69_02220 [Pyrinomonadaceae bacterium]|nr:hypothetical protein [Pyrinomonadaceae bacterium]